MASLLFTRGFHSLIAERDTTGQNIAWNAISKRAAREQHSQPVAEAVFWVLVVVNVCILVPVFFVLAYTIDKIFPTLASVEADTPPEYELVVTQESNVQGSEVQKDGKLNGASSSKDTIEPDLENAGESSSSKLMPVEMAGLPATSSKPITSSLRDTLRLLRASSSGLFKAYRWRFLYNCIYGVVFWVTFQIPFLPFILLSSFLASLAATKVETAWTHAVISSKYDGNLYKKLPSYLTIVKATAIPLAAEAVMTHVISIIATLLVGKRSGTVDARGFDIVSAGIFCVTLFTLHACLLIPVEVVLVRTRAAMLAEDAPTMVSLDSSILAQNAEDIGFMSWLHAWRTFSRASWIRVAKANAKSLGAIIGTEIVAAVLLFAQSGILNAIASSGN